MVNQLLYWSLPGLTPACRSIRLLLGGVHLEGIKVSCLLPLSCLTQPRLLCALRYKHFFLVAQIVASQFRWLEYNDNKAKVIGLVHVQATMYNIFSFLLTTSPIKPLPYIQLQMLHIYLKKYLCVSGHMQFKPVLKGQSIHVQRHTHIYILYI